MGTPFLCFSLLRYLKYHNTFISCICKYSSKIAFVFLSISSFGNSGCGVVTGDGRSFSGSRPLDLSLGVISADWLIPILL